MMITKAITLNVESDGQILQDYGLLPETLLYIKTLCEERITEYDIIFTKRNDEIFLEVKSRWIVKRFNLNEVLLDCPTAAEQRAFIAVATLHDGELSLGDLTRHVLSQYHALYVYTTLAAERALMATISRLVTDTECQKLLGIKYTAKRYNFKGTIRALPAFKVAVVLAAAYTLTAAIS